MLPASFSLSPVLWVLLYLSEPAKSHSVNLEHKWYFQNNVILTAH